MYPMIYAFNKCIIIIKIFFVIINIFETYKTSFQLFFTLVYDKLFVHILMRVGTTFLTS